VRAGRLRHRVALERRTTGTDAFGSVVQSWDRYATVWADVAPLSGREMLADGQVRSDVSHRVRIRHLDGVAETDRIVHRGRTLEVVAVMNMDERDRTLEVLAMERTT